MPAACCICTPTTNLKFSSNVGSNPISRSSLPFLSFATFSNRAAAFADVSTRSVEPEELAFANYRQRNPERVSFGLRVAAQPTQMLMRWNGPTVWCLHCDPRNAPSKRILWLRESLRGFLVPWLNQRVGFTEMDGLPGVIRFRQKFCHFNHQLPPWGVMKRLRHSTYLFHFNLSERALLIVCWSSALNAWTAMPTLKQYEREAVKWGCQHLYFSRHDRPFKPWWV